MAEPTPIIVTDSVRIMALAQGCGEPHCHVCGHVFEIGDAACVRDAVASARMTLRVLCCPEHGATALGDYEIEKQTRILAILDGPEQASHPSPSGYSQILADQHAGPAWIVQNEQPTP